MEQEKIDALKLNPTKRPTATDSLIDALKLNPTKRPAATDSLMEQKKIDALKRQYGAELFLIEVEGEQPFVLKKPNLTTVSAFSKVSQADPIKAATIVLNDCIVEGDKSRIEDPEVMLALTKHINSLMVARQSSIKKL